MSLTHLWTLFYFPSNRFSRYHFIFLTSRNYEIMCNRLFLIYICRFALDGVYYTDQPKKIVRMPPTCSFIPFLTQNRGKTSYGNFFLIF